MKVLFLCHGNICRSVMAEYMFKDMVKDKDIYVDSAALTTEEIGNPIYPPAKRKLIEKGVTLGTHRARLAKRSDYENFDYLIGMDRENKYDMDYLFGEDVYHKRYLLMDFTGKAREISDPWYTGDFETAYNDIKEGLEALLKEIENHG